MNKNIPEELARLSAALKGLECWYVSCGGAAGSTFQLTLGGKVRRPVPLKNPAHSEEFRQFEGEVGLFVWCAWRLDGTDGPVTSWDDTNESVEAGLKKLIGSRIDAVEVVPPAWDMNIKFSNSLCLRVFCDHVPGEPSFDGNWDVRTREMSIAVGPGTKCRTEHRPSVKH
jgi:hypothetical protein